MSDTPATLSVAAAQAARVALPCTCDGLEPHDLSCASAIPDSALRGALEAARPHLAAAECELLTDAYRALLSSALRALTVKPTLDTPYTDDPRWSPWTRWVEPEARRAHDLAQRIRKHLREHGVQPPSGPHGAVPGIWPELPAGAARVAELEDALREMLATVGRTVHRDRHGEAHFARWQAVLDRGSNE